MCRPSCACISSSSSSNRAGMSDQDAAGSAGGWERSHHRFMGVLSHTCTVVGLIHGQLLAWHHRHYMAPEATGVCGATMRYVYRKNT